MTENVIREMQDRIAIRELVDDYAFLADSGEAQKQADLFTEDTVYIVEYLDMPEANQTLTGRDALVPLFEGLASYHTKTHFNGQSKVYDLTEDTARGIVYCLAHHITLEDGQQSNMVASIRYDDDYVKVDGQWKFAKRHLRINFVENR